MIQLTIRESVLALLEALKIVVQHGQQDGLDNVGADKIQKIIDTYTKRS